MSLYESFLNADFYGIPMLKLLMVNGRCSMKK